MYEWSWPESNRTLQIHSPVLSLACIQCHIQAVFWWDLYLFIGKEIRQKDPSSNSKLLQLLTPNSFEGEQIVIYSSCSQFLLNCTKSSMTLQDSTSNWMLHEKKTNSCQVLGIWKISSFLGQGGRADLKSTEGNEKDLLTSMGFSPALMEQVWELDLCSYNLPALMMTAASLQKSNCRGENAQK